MHKKVNKLWTQFAAQAPAAARLSLGPGSALGPQDSQVGQAGLAHSGGDGFDGRQHGVQQLGQLPCPFGLAPLFHHVAGQGEHVRFKGASVCHLGEAVISPNPSFLLAGTLVYLAL